MAKKKTVKIETTEVKVNAKRGRPKKTVEPLTEVKRGRGRPKKVLPELLIEEPIAVTAEPVFEVIEVRDLGLWGKIKAFFKK